MIEETTWHMLEGLYRKYPEIKCGNATDFQIQEAEQELGLLFSDFYRYFLKYHEVSRVGSWPVKTLNISPDSAASNWSVIEVNKNLGHSVKFPDGHKNWYIVSSNPRGDLIPLNEKGEVWILYRDILRGSEKIADNFEQFLHRLLIDFRSKSG